MKFFLSGEIDIKISDTFRRIRKEIEGKLKELENISYGSEVEDIGIIPIIVDITPELEEAGFFKEIKRFNKKNKEADVRLRMNFNKFSNSDIKIQKLLMIKNVIESIRVLSEKAIKDFEANRLEEDILNLFCIKKEEIDSLKM